MANQLEEENRPTYSAVVAVHRPPPPPPTLRPIWGLTDLTHCLDCPGCPDRRLTHDCVNAKHRVMEYREYNKMVVKLQEKKTCYLGKLMQYGDDVLVITTDASYRKNVGVCLSVVLRTGKLKYLIGYTRFIPMSHRLDPDDSNYIAESEAIAWGLELAFLYIAQNPGKFSSIALLTDCLPCAKAYYSGKERYPAFDDAYIPRNYINAMRYFGREPQWVQEGVSEVNPIPKSLVSVSFIYREINPAANALAATGRTHVWNEVELPYKIKQILLGDKYLTRFRVDR